MELKKTLKRLFLFVLIAFLVGLVIVSLAMFNVNITKLFNQYSIRSVTEVQSLYIQVLQQKFSDQFSMLESQARYFYDVDLSSEAELKKTITETHGIGEFKKIAVASKDGVCTNYTGQNLANIKNKSYFIQTIKTGERQISDRIELDENLEPTLILTYPLMRGSEVEAVLIGTLSYNTLKNQFSTSLFSGVGYTYLIADDSNIIMCNKDKKKVVYNVNFFDYMVNSGVQQNESLQKIKLDIINGASDVVVLSGTESEKIFSYAPLEINGWYIVCVIPYFYVKNQLLDVNILVIVLLVIISFIVVGFLLLLYGLFKQNSSMEKDNDRLTIANSQNQAMIFEYDLQKKVVDFSGDTKFVLGVEKKSLSVEFLKGEYYRRVHADDGNILKHVKDAIENHSTDFSTEFRYLNFSNTYIWLRMTGTVILREDGVPAKFIGSITNVNAQVLHEQELKSMAELDKLTGLLNKTAMETHTRELLSNGENCKNYALIILDLDNFKQVNDKLGHLMGDMAILDSAKKLSLIFSEKDLISRFGGDEFCILLRISHDLSSDTALRIVNDKVTNLCTMLREWYFDDQNSVPVSASVGVALYSEDACDYEELFKKADAALYEVKLNGKDNFKISEK